MLGGIVSGGYLYLGYSFAGYFPYSCSLPVPILEGDRAPLPAEPAEDPAACPVGPSSGSCQEIIDVTGQGETLLSLLDANLADESEVRKVASILASVIQTTLKKSFNGSTPLQAGKRYSISVDADGHFLQATVEMAAAEVFHAVRGRDGIRAWKEEVVLDFKNETISFPVNGTLAESVLKVGEGTELALKLTNVFRYDIDFQSEARRGDVCKVLVQRRYADDRPAGYGEILCAVYDGKKTGRKVAVLFKDEYYDGAGRELKKDLLRSPLSVIRVTSKMGNRFHPVLRVWRKHKGVDYGAARGTPVRCVASGVVTFSGWYGEYGNLVWVKHDNGLVSKYGHLSKILVKTGRRVTQRDCVGLVGMTGLATGPHLHFELLKNDRHINPLSVMKRVTTDRTVAEPLMPRFNRLAQERLHAIEGMTFTQRAEERRTSAVR